MRVPLLLPCAQPERARRVAFGLTLLLLTTLATFAQTPFSVRLDGIRYEDSAGRLIDYDFSSGQLVQDDPAGDRIVIPESAIQGRGAGETETAFFWAEPMVVADTTASLADGVLSIGVEQTAPAVRLGVWALLTNGALAPAPVNWSYEAVSSGFDGVGTEGRVYSFGINGGSNQPDIEPEISATWFTGWYNGAYYQNALALQARLKDEVTGQEWASDDLPLLGLDPATTALGLRIAVTGANAMTASYRLGGDGWQPFWQHTLAEGQIPGFPDRVPALWLRTEAIGITQFIVERGDSVGDPNGRAYAVEVQGGDLTGLQVTTPWDESVDTADYLPAGWAGEPVNAGSWESGFAFEADSENGVRRLNFDWHGLSVEQWAAVDTAPSSVIVTWDGGSWTAPIDFTPAPMPTAAPVVTFPTAGATGVDIQPTFVWQQWATLGIHAAGIWWELTDNTGQELYEEVHAPAATTSWTPPQPLLPGADYEFVVDFHHAPTVSINSQNVTIVSWLECQAVGFRTVAAVPRVDLTAAVLGPTIIVADPDQQLVVDIKAVNGGIDPAAPNPGSGDRWYTQLYISSDPIVAPPEDMHVGGFSLTELAAGAEHTGEIMFYAPTTPGTYFLAARADDVDNVAESNETNNWSALVTLVVQAAGAGRLVVAADGPYEVWAGSERHVDIPYYDVDQLPGYVKLGEAVGDAEFPGGYRFYVVATTTAFLLDAVQLPNGNYLDGNNHHEPGNYVSWGNVHLPGVAGGNDQFIYGPPDGQTNEVGGGSTGAAYQGFVVAENAPFSVDFDVTYVVALGPGQDTFAAGQYEGTPRWQLLLRNRLAEPLDVGLVTFAAPCEMTDLVSEDAGSPQVSSPAQYVYTWDSPVIADQGKVQAIQTCGGIPKSFPVSVTREWSPHVLTDSGNVQVTATIGVPPDAPALSSLYANVTLVGAQDENVSSPRDLGAAFAVLTHVSVSYTGPNVYLDSQESTDVFQSYEIGVNTPEVGATYTVTAVVHYELLSGIDSVAIEPVVGVGFGLPYEGRPQATWQAGELALPTGGTVSVADAALGGEESIDWYDIQFYHRHRGFTAAEQPDLVAAIAGAASLQAAAGQALELDVTVTNSGDADAVRIDDPQAMWSTTLYISSDQTFGDPADTAVAGSARRALAAGTGDTRTLGFSAPATPGTYYLAAQADSGGNVPESDETNNWSATVTLVVGAVEIPVEFVDGYSLLGLPLAGSGLAVAADILAWAPNATAVYAFDVVTQSWLVYLGSGGDNFAVEPGMAVFVACDRNGSTTMSGQWADLTSYTFAQPGYALLCLSQAGAALTSARTLLATVPNGEAVWTWLPVEQRWRGYVAGFGGDDFPVVPGTPFLVAVDAPGTWMGPTD